jgi:hypothetical protein
MQSGDGPHVRISGESITFSREQTDITRYNSFQCSFTTRGLSCLKVGVVFRSAPKLWLVELKYGANLSKGRKTTLV